MSWNTGEIRSISYGKTIKIVNKRAKSIHIEGLSYKEDF